MKTRPLFTAESHTPFEVTAQVITPMEPKKVAKLGDVPVTTPKLQNTASRERPSQVSTFKCDVGQLPQLKPKPSPDHMFIQILENYTREEEPSPLQLQLLPCSTYSAITLPKPTPFMT